MLCVSLLLDRGVCSGCERCRFILCREVDWMSNLGRSLKLNTLWFLEYDLKFSRHEPKVLRGVSYCVMGQDTKNNATQAIP